ncbi:MAG TPA: hypothetical protein VM842_02310, partial [Nitrospira sp.]|nr:hypothetical protein [Nitrospira sp.]
MKKPTSVLGSLTGAAYGLTVRRAAALPAALLDGIFERPVLDAAAGSHERAQSWLLIRWVRAASPAQYDQGRDGEKEEPERRAAIGCIGELDEVRQTADQERHAGHDRVAEGG